MGTKQYDSATDLITFSRTSSATFLGSNGLLQTAAANTPRIDYDYNGTVKGLLIEVQRTNLITYSAASVANWADSSALSRTDSNENALGVFDGVIVASNGLVWQGTNSPGFTTTSGVDYAVTAWIKKGTSPNFSIRLRDHAGSKESLVKGVWGSSSLVAVANAGAVSNESITYITDTLAVVSFTIIRNSTSSNTYIRISPASTTSGETIIALGAQVEVGSFPTSYIPTTGSTATRTNDIASIAVENFGYNQDEGTLVVEFEADSWAQNANTQKFNRVWEFTGNTGSNADGIFRDPATGDGDYLRYRFNESDATTAALGPANLDPVSGVTTEAVALGQGDAEIVMNGGTPATGSGTAAIDKYTGILLGRSSNNTNLLNGYIRDFQYYPRRLTNAQLQELTT